MRTRTAAKFRVKRSKLPSALSTRSEAIVHAELKRGISSLATIGSTAPFVGLFGTVVGIINAFKGIATEKSAGLGAVAGGISEALVTTAVGLFVAVPAVWMFNYFTQAGSVRRRDGQLQLGTDRLLHQAFAARRLRKSIVADSARDCELRSAARHRGAPGSCEAGTIERRNTR